MRPARHVIPPILTGVVLAVLALGCTTSDKSSGSPTAMPATLACTVGSAAIPAGSGVPVSVTGIVTRGGVPARGARVTFTADRGGVFPGSVTTGFDGRAVASYLPPDTPGTDVVRLSIDDGSDVITAACVVSVTSGGSDPLLRVDVLAPSELAGLRVIVAYPAARVRLPAGAAEVTGSFADVIDGRTCLDAIEDDGAGRVELSVACAELRPAGGTQVATFGFDNLGEALVGAGSFAVSCNGFDEDGSPLPTSCRLRVEQL